MSDLRAAAARLLKTIDGVFLGCPVEPGKMILTSDVIAVCNAYLALVHADDGEAIDEPWLRSVGFRDWPDTSDLPEFELWLPMADEITWECRLTYQSNGFYAVRMCDPNEVEGGLSAESVELFNSRNIKTPITRGRIRRLCQALGIDLKEHING